MCEKYGWPEAFVETVDSMMQDLNVEGLHPIEGEEVIDERIEEQGGFKWHEHHGHVPYRSDCRVCVAAKGRDSPHRRLEHPEVIHDFPEAQADYCYIGVTNSEGETTHAFPIFVAVVKHTGAAFSAVSC